MALKVGDTIPQFMATDSHGKTFESSTIVGQKPVVVYFYPKDDTPGCTAQACSFRDQYQDFTDIGAEVIGISSDNQKSHEKFAKKHNLPFVLLADDNKKLRNLFGVPSGLLGLIPGRVTYVADKNGVVKMIFDSMLATKHIPKALEAVKRLI